MDIFKDTSLHQVEELGGSERVGSGSLGATIWLPSTLVFVAGQWKDTSLDQVQELGGSERVGSGSLGATIWDKTL